MILLFYCTYLVLYICDFENKHDGTKSSTWKCKRIVSSVLTKSLKYLLHDPGWQDDFDDIWDHQEVWHREVTTSLFHDYDW